MKTLALCLILAPCALAQQQYAPIGSKTWVDPQGKQANQPKPVPQHCPNTDIAVARWDCDATFINATPTQAKSLTLFRFDNSAGLFTVVTCSGVSGTWGNDDYKVTGCSLGKDFTLDEALTQIFREQQRSLKQKDDDYKTLSNIIHRYLDDQIAILSPHKPAAPVKHCVKHEDGKAYIHCAYKPKY